MSENLVLLGNKIKNLRKKRGITQEQLAEMVDRSKNHISKIELGLTNPPVSLIFDIFDKLGVKSSQLFVTDDIVADYNSSDFYAEVSKIVDSIIKNKAKEVLSIILS